MASNNKYGFITLFFLLLISDISLCQSLEKKYTHESAALELESTTLRIKAGESFELNPNVFEYIYTNYSTFPTIPSDANLEERMQSLTTTFSQLTLILRSLVIESRDSISVEHAMIMACLGYNSVKLLTAGNEFMQNLNENNFNYNISVKGYDQATTGIQNFLLGYISITFLENQYQGVDGILTSSLLTFAPKIMDVLPKDKRKNTVKLIKKSVKNKNDLRLKEEYQKLLKLL